MAGTYAKETEVPVSRSFDEIKRTLQRFGASAFGYAEEGPNVGVSFQIDGLRILMRMTLPERSQFELSPTGRWRSAAAIETEWEKACRQRWRTLAAGIKAKLALVDDGISTVEREFLADVMTATGETIGQLIAPEIREIVVRGELPPILPGMERGGRVIALAERTGR